ncbi:MAG: hypothetical protein MI749_18825 [Desulfovibrionales bacterium]|nr:hypothetical protein [Desulfovibrionales bacterium]
MKVLGNYGKPHTPEDVGRGHSVRGTMQSHANEAVAENAWKGKGVVCVQTAGVFKEYCLKFTADESMSNQMSAENIWRKQVIRYGVENARQGLELLSPRFGGLGELKARHGGITFEEDAGTNLLSCGNIRSVLKDAALNR